MPPITVNNLRVESVSGPTCYAGENGFSALTAYVKSEDADVLGRLRRAANDGTTVVVRCATLEIEGKVGKLQFSSGKGKEMVAISVDDLRYFKPRSRIYPERSADLAESLAILDRAMEDAKAGRCQPLKQAIREIAMELGLKLDR